MLRVRTLYKRAACKFAGRVEKDNSDAYVFKHDFWKRRKELKEEANQLFSSIVPEADEDEEDYGENLDAATLYEKKKLGAMDQEQYDYFEELQRLKRDPLQGHSELIRIHSSRDG